MMGLIRRLHGVYKGYKGKPKRMTMPKIPFIYNYLNGRYNHVWEQHDIDYTPTTVDRVSRAEADWQMREHLLAAGSTKLLAYSAWAAVRLFGGKHYNELD